MKPKKHGLRLLSKLEALAARAPTSEQEIRRMFDYVIELLKQQFDAYLIDIMWEDKQAAEVELRAYRMYETEENGYDSRPVYSGQTGLGEPTSLTAWCYVNRCPVWIVDETEAGISSTKDYVNLLPDIYGRYVSIPKGTIYEYNQAAKMRAEICLPLSVEIRKGWTRTAGVLNIETTKQIFPSPRALDVAHSAAYIIQQLQSRLVMLTSAANWAEREMTELQQLYSTFTQKQRSEPSLEMCCFVVRPMDFPSADDIYAWLRDELQRRRVQVNVIITTGSIVEEIWNSLRACHFGIVISTNLNRNVLIEWGFLLGAGKPVIRLHQSVGDNATDPFDVFGTMKFEYAEKNKTPAEAGVRKAIGDGFAALLKGNPELRDLAFTAPVRREEIYPKSSM